MAVRVRSEAPGGLVFMPRRGVAWLRERAWSRVKAIRTIRMSPDCSSQHLRAVSSFFTPVDIRFVPRMNVVLRAPSETLRRHLIETSDGCQLLDVSWCKSSTRSRWCLKAPERAGLSAMPWVFVSSAWLDLPQCNKTLPCVISLRKWPVWCGLCGASREPRLFTDFDTYAASRRNVVFW